MRLGSLYFRVAGAVIVRCCQVRDEEFLAEVIEDFCTRPYELADCDCLSLRGVRNGSSLVPVGVTVAPRVCGKVVRLYEDGLGIPELGMPVFDKGVELLELVYVIPVEE